MLDFFFFCEKVSPGLELRSSCLHSQQFPTLVISPAHQRNVTDEGGVCISQA